MSYIDFILGKKLPGRKTDVWKVVSVQDGAELGVIGWYGPWRKYSFFVTGGKIFESKCLMDIVQFLDRETKVYKAKRQGSS